MWAQRHIFIATAAALVGVASGQVCQKGCTKWFDGCNTCRCDADGNPLECTGKEACEEKKKPQCLDKVVEVCPATCSSWFDGCNNCNCEKVGTVGKVCTEKKCELFKEPSCNMYNCDSEETWTPDKTAWCCKKEQKGCPPDQVCSDGCAKWFNGCNTCKCDADGKPVNCTEEFCEKIEEPKCIDKVVDAPDVYITFPELGLGEVVDTDEKDREDFKAKLQKMNGKVPGWLEKISKPNKTPKVIKPKRSFLCTATEANQAQCNVAAGEKCLRRKVPVQYDEKKNYGDSDSADSDAKGQGTTGTRKLQNQKKFKYKPWCLRPCAKVCTGISLRCGQLAEDPPAYPIWWHNFENRRCYQMEKKQGANKFFMRWSCRCPDRDYTVSDSCTANAGASLSNCVRAWIVQAPEINFQDLSSVQLGYVRSTDKDIDFQGKVQKSIFCRIDAHEDVEIGGGFCPAKLQNNVFFNTVMKKDFQFEEGATMKSNIFFNVEVGDDFEVKDETGSYTTTIKDNLFGTVQVADDCKIAAGVSGVTINNNYCGTFTHSVGSSGCGDPPFADPGFSCL